MKWLVMNIGKYPVILLMALVIGVAVKPVWAGREGRKDADIKITSPVFNDGEMMPDRCGYNNENMSPPIAWTLIPENTKSLAIICDDSDAPLGMWNHWIVFNIPARSIGLPEGLPKDGVLEDGATQGMNDFKKIGYDGPSPPRGVHRYYFKIYALDRVLDLKPGVDRQVLLKAMEGHIIGYGQLMGRFRR